MTDRDRQYPYPDALRPDTAPAPHEFLAPVTGLLGTWVGTGRGGYPTLAEEFTYAQEVTFSHDGRPFLHYEARAWLIDADGTRCARRPGRAAGGGSSRRAASRR